MINFLPCDLIPFVEKQDCYRRHLQWSWWHRPHQSCNQNQINKATQPQRWWACLKSTPRPSSLCCPPAEVRRALIGDHPLPASHPLDCVKTNLQSLLLMSIWGNFQTPFENRPPPLEPWHCTELWGAPQGQALQERGWRGGRRVPSWRWTVLMMLLVLWRGGGGIRGLLGSSLFEQIWPVWALSPALWYEIQQLSAEQLHCKTSRISWERQNNVKSWAKSLWYDDSDLRLNEIFWHLTPE